MLLVRRYIYTALAVAVVITALDALVCLGTIGIAAECARYILFAVVLAIPIRAVLLLATSLVLHTLLSKLLSNRAPVVLIVVTLATVIVYIVSMAVTHP